MDKKNNTFSDLIVAYLEQIGVEYVFGIPGGHILSLYESLYRSEKRGGPRAVMTRHETGAAFMAAGYARETGKIGVCCATCGPGATNIITGLAEASANHAPLLVITGQIPLPGSGRGGLQECTPHQGYFPDIADTVGMLEHCTCYNTVINHPAQLEGKLTAAIISAMQPVRGPAHISIPVDILRAPGPDTPAYPNLSRLLNTDPAFADSAAMEGLWQAVADVLKRNRGIAVFVGHECEGAGQEIMRFAEMINAPVVTSLRGKSRVDAWHPLNLGVFGMSGHQSARQALADESIELILAAGTSLGLLATGAWSPVLLNEKLVHIHPSNVYFPRSSMARMHVPGTVKTVFRELADRLHGAGLQVAGDKLQTQGSEREDVFPPQIELHKPEACYSEEIPVKPQRLIYELRRNFPRETRFVADSGASLDWVLHYLFLPNPENCRLTAVIQFPMGAGVGGAVGTAIGAPNTPVVCVVGDGTYLMYGQEIGVAVAEKLPVIFVILNDGAYGSVKHRNRQIGTEDIDFALPPTDFSLMAKAVGADGYTVRHPDDFRHLDYQAMCNRPGPTLIDVYVDPEEMPPIGV
ncbi:MAG: thiamine pyrophosphate-binding protein [Desulfobacterales bacterium]|nr:thiamine pyrophosphate-binding protein [Desulfobacterales bacterium]